MKEKNKEIVGLGKDIVVLEKQIGVLKKRLGLEMKERVECGMMVEKCVEGKTREILTLE